MHARRWVLVVGALTVVVGAAVQVVTGFIADRPPVWLADPVRGWLVLLVLVLLLVVFGFAVGPAGDAAGPGRVARPRFGEVVTSLRPPDEEVMVRGREKELQLLGRLTKAPKGQFGVVCAAGGVGKTTLAAAAAARARQAGLTVFWIHYRGATDLAGRLAEVAVGLGLPPARVEAAQHSGASVSDLVWDYLDRVRGWLIVVDNLDQPAETVPQGERLRHYRGWIRPSRAGLLVVTSRDRHAGSWGRAARLVDLGPLPPHAGAQVLRDAAPHAGSPQEAQILSHRLGGLPLALRAAGALINERTSPYRSFTAYRAALDRRAVSVVPQAPDVTDPAIARTLVGHTWELSLDQLAEQGYPLARPILRLLALLAQAPIPRTLITAQLLHQATGVPRPPPPTQIDLALAGLDRYGLIEAPYPSRTLGIPTLLLHPLVREATTELLTRTTDPTPWRTALDQTLIDQVSQTVRQQRAGWDTARLLAPHLAVLTGLHGNHPALPTAQQTIGQLADLLSDAGHHHSELELRQTLLQVYENVLGANHPDTLLTRHSVANALFGLGLFRPAAELHEATLTDAERTLGHENPLTLTIRQALASALTGLGHWSRAFALHEETLSARERILGPDHLDTLQSRQFYGALLLHRGKYRAAAEVCRQALRDRQRILGADHTSTLETLGGLASTLWELGERDQALQLFWQCVTARARTLGINHPDTLRARHNYAFALALSGRHREAVELFQQVVATKESILGPENHYTLSSRTGLAFALAGTGQHRQAEQLLQHTLATCQHTLGPENPVTLESRQCLAKVLTQLKQFSQAAGLHQQNLTVMERTLGPSHPTTLSNRHGLAIALTGLKRHEQAFELHRQTLLDREGILGPDHPDTIQSREHLRAAQATIGRTHKNRHLGHRT